MIQLCNKVSVSSLLQRTYLDKDGQQRIFNYRSVIAKSGSNEWCGDLTGDAAVKWPYEHVQSNYHLWQIDFYATIRNYADKDGNTRYQQEIRFREVVPML